MTFNVTLLYLFIYFLYLHFTLYRTGPYLETGCTTDTIVPGAKFQMCLCRRFHSQICTLILMPSFTDN